MKWEIMITVSHPGAMADIIHRTVDAAKNGDVAFVSVNAVNEGD